MRICTFFHLIFKDTFIYQKEWKVEGACEREMDFVANLNAGHVRICLFSLF